MTTSVRPVRKAVFPVAGFGTRFLPATKAQPKEMLPVVDKPLIQYAVEEAYAAGIRHMIFVTGRNKRAIEDHFDTAFELEAELEAKNKTALLAIARSILPDDMALSYVRQPRMLGLGHAVLCAEHLVGDEPFAVLLADDLMTGERAVLAQMADVYNRTGASVLAVQEVPQDQTGRYGIVVGETVEDRLIKVSHMVEKPKPETAPSRMAAAGRYILTPGVFDQIRQQTSGAGGEIQLTDAIADEIAEGRGVYGLRFRGERFDCGSKAGFLQATVAFGLAREELKHEFAEYLSVLNTTLKAAE